MSDQHDNIKKLRDLVDDTADKIVNGELSAAEAEALVRNTREKAELLIPEDMDKYDLIYQTRFERLIDQFIKQKQFAG
jgi:hypothetical protein